MNQQEEKLLRKFLRENIVKNLLAQQKKQYLAEQKVRKFVRSLIHEVREETILETLFESRDMANPHPSTGINKLRDAIRKAKPSIKTKYQQLTTNKEQRDSFRNHFLAAFVRLFEQLDALSASESIDDEVLDVADEFADMSDDTDVLQAPPEEEMDKIEKDIEDLVESILNEIDIEIEDQDQLASDQWNKLKDNPNLEEIIDDLYSALENFEDEDNVTAVQYNNLGFDKKGLRRLITGLELGSDPAKFNDVVSKDLESEKEKSRDVSQIEKDVEKKKAQEREREKFGQGIQGDATGRNQAFDTFNLVQSYFSDNYLDLDSTDDKEMFKKWCLYNLKLLLDSYEQELTPQLEEPNIQDPT